MNHVAEAFLCRGHNTSFEISYQHGRIGGVKAEQTQWWLALTWSQEVPLVACINPRVVGQDLPLGYAAKYQREHQAWTREVQMAASALN